MILRLTQTERLKQREPGRRREKERERNVRESGENKCERKILNDQNSSHKTLGLRPCLLLGADKALQLCQLPSKLHHENTLKPQREVLEQQEGSEQHQTSVLLFCTVCSLIFFFLFFLPNNALHTVHTLHCRFTSHTSPAIMSCTGDREW